MMIPDINSPENPLFISTSLLADLFFIFKYKHSSSFASRQDMVAAAAILTISYYKGGKIEAVIAASMSSLRESEDDVVFLLHYSAIFSKLILDILYRDKISSEIKQKFTQACAPAILLAIKNSEMNIKNSQFQDNVLGYANGFIKGYQHDKAAIHNYIASFIDAEAYALFSKNSIQRDPQQGVPQESHEKQRHQAHGYADANKSTGIPSLIKYLFGFVILVCLAAPFASKLLDTRSAPRASQSQIPRLVPMEPKKEAPVRPSLESPTASITGTWDAPKETPPPIPEIADNWVPSKPASVMSAPPERQGVPTQPQPSRGKNTVQFTLKGVPIIIPMPVNYTEVPEFAGEAMEINNIKARGIAMYEKSYENGNVASIYSVLSFDVFEDATVTISNFQEYKTGIKSQDTGAMNRIYDAANQTTGDPQIDLVGHPEIFIDEERAIGVYNRSSSVLEAMPISTYTATLSLLINGKIIMTTYSAMTQEPQDNYPEVVKNTARKWIDAILAAN